MISQSTNRTQHEQDSFDVLVMVRDVVDAIWQYKWTVAITCLLVLGMATLYLYVWPPQYRATAMVMVEREADNARDDFYTAWNVFRKEDARSEIELMTSGPILERVIEREQLGYDDIYRPVTSQLRYFWETSWIGAQYYGLRDRFFPPEHDVQMTADEIEYGRTIDDMPAGINILPIGESNVAEVTMTGPSPRVAQVANTLLDTYIEWRQELHQSEAARAMSVLAEEAEAAKQELREIEDRRTAFLEESGLILDTQRELMQIELLTTLEGDIARTEEQIIAKQAALAEVERRLAEEQATRVVSSSREFSAIREAAKQRRLELQFALIQASERYRQDSPEVQEIQRSIDEVDAIIAGEPEWVQSSQIDGVNTVHENLLTSRDRLRSELAGSKAGLETFKTKMNELEARLSRLPAISAELHRLERDYRHLNQKYDTLATRRAQAEVSYQTVATTMPSMRVVGYAYPPSSKSWPTLRIIYPAALIVGMGLGVFAAMIRYYASGRVRRGDLLRERERMTVFGTVRVPTRGRPLEVAAPTRTVPNSKSSTSQI